MQPLRAQEGTPPGSGPSGKEKGTSRGLFLPPNTPLSQSSGYVIFRTPGFKKLRISRLSQRRIKPNRALLRRRLATARVTHQSRHPCLSTTHPPSDARGCGRHSGAWGPLSSQSSASEGKSRERATDWGGGDTSFCSAATSRKTQRPRPRGGLVQRAGGEGGPASGAQRCTFLLRLGLGCEKGRQPGR